MNDRVARSGRHRQRGAALLITVVIILTVALFGAIVAGAMSGADIIGSSQQGYSVEALYAAESGLDRALKQFTTGTACASLGAGPITVVSGRTFTTTSFSTDFSGATLSSSECRVQAAGTVSGTGVTRTIQAIFDNSLVGGTGVNADFNNPSGTGTVPTGWTGGSYDYTGGPDPTGSAPTSCTRAAYAVKGRSGNFTASAAGNINPNFTVPAGTVLTVSFDYRVVEISNANPPPQGCLSGAGGSACAGARDPGSPGSSNAETTFCFSVTDSLGVTSNSTTWEVDPANATALSNRVQLNTSPACQHTTQQATPPVNYSACSTYYNNNSLPAKGSVTITMGGGAGTDRLVNQLTYNIWMKPGQAKEAWLDNIVITSASATGGASMTEWRDCSVTSCP